MELSTRVQRIYASPVGPLEHLQDLVNGEGDYNTTRYKEADFLELVQPSHFWHTSCLNPANRIDLFCEDFPHEWRVHCTASSGRRIMVTPSFQLCIPPLQIYVSIPDQHNWPINLRSSLEAGASFHIRDTRCRALNINRYITTRLSLWSSKIDDFEAFYRSLPFATTIRLKDFNGGSMYQDFDVEYSDLEGFLGVKDLWAMWNIPLERQPTLIPIHHLKFRSQVHESVSIVTLDNSPDSIWMAMKSTIESPGLLYHEIKTLLSLPEHTHVMGRPYYLVTDIEPLKPAAKIVGFVMEFLPRGSLAEALIHPLYNPGKQLSASLRWALQITSTLIHLKDDSNYTYTDLKTDNIMIRDVNGDLGDAVLVDFEQNGTANSWSAPEIYHVETLELASRIVSDFEKKQQYQKLLLDLTGFEKNFSCRTYCNPLHGHNIAWASLTPEEKEAAQVFALGKILFCIFECVGSATIQIALSMPQEQSRVEFPHFLKTPIALRPLILDCTQGARELYNKDIPILRRVDDRLFGHLRGITFETELQETVEASRAYWLSRINQMERHVNYRLRLRKGQGHGQGKDESSAYARPTLQLVLQTLQAFNFTEQYISV
ncbi:hypothetical protein V495_06709 [Pseudogymnoascus sp. VKM F-4514 (FW-929)]|nr:hypothetical protein V495_06709 [Pseudogymnoascus sp. VKM F-4514 (FW-929)]KFY62229.1 hypothetical protein V497_02502 [Pseudogymnoascus sp. VKM F-4516 (FW-969)]